MRLKVWTIFLILFLPISVICYFRHLDLDRIVDPLRTTVQSKVKANSVKQEYEKQDELKRSALRAVSALCAIPDASKWRYAF